MNSTFDIDKIGENHSVAKDYQNTNSALEYYY